MIIHKAYRFHLYPNLKQIELINLILQEEDEQSIHADVKKNPQLELMGIFRLLLSGRG